MFRSHSHTKSHFATGFETLELIFHVSVRNLRKTHGNAVLGLVVSIVQSVVLVGIMYLMFSLLGISRIAVRGDFLLFVMSGVFMFTVHIAALGAVSRAEGPTSPMMMHAPMNPIISISGAALAVLYTQTLCAAIILFLYHAIFSPITFEDPVGMLGLYLLSWISGVGIGMVLLSARPWQPDLVSILTSVFMRANMIASGKMLLANNTPPGLRVWFDWNPLFHVIDQGRGYIFLNYTPRTTSISYAVYVALSCVLIGLMAEFFTRQYASASWGKRG